MNSFDFEVEVAVLRGFLPVVVGGWSVPLTLELFKGHRYV